MLPSAPKANTNALVIDTASNSRTITMTNNCPHPSPGGAALEMRFRERSYVRAEGPSKMQNPAHLFVKRDLYFAGRRVRRASSSAAAKTSLVNQPPYWSLELLYRRVEG